MLRKTSVYFRTSSIPSNLKTRKNTGTSCLIGITIRGGGVETSLISGVANSITRGGYIDIFLFTDHRNNRFQKKLIVQKRIYVPEKVIELWSALARSIFNLPK